MKKNLLLLLILTFIIRANITAQELPSYLHDRGTGIRSSLFATYVKSHELVLYPFFEYYLDNTYDYSPDQFGINSDSTYSGKYRATEEQFFFAYAFNDWLYFESEMAVIQATLQKSPGDLSAMPSSYSESGLGDMQSLVTLRWLKENAHRPEIWSYVEADYPFQKTRVITGTQFLEVVAGTGLIKGFKFGTFTVRGAAAWSTEDNQVSFGEFAWDYLKRFSPSWVVSAGMEDDGGELEAITEVQYHFSDHVYLRANNAFGLNPASTDWSPEVGFVISPLHLKN